MIRSSVWLCLLFGTTAWSQSAPVGTEPSPMEAFATVTGIRTAWSVEVGHLQYSAIQATFTAVALVDGGRQISGLVVDLSARENGDGGESGVTRDKIYLDEEAARRTRDALIEIADAIRQHRCRTDAWEQRNSGPCTTGPGTSTTN